MNESKNHKTHSLKDLTYMFKVFEKEEKKEKQLARFKSLIIHQIDDEEHGITTYNALIILARQLGLAENVRDLQIMLNEEVKHKSILESMRNTWITHSQLYGDNDRTLSHTLKEKEVKVKKKKRLSLRQDSRL